MKYRFFLFVLSLSLVLAACGPLDLRDMLPMMVTITPTPPLLNSPITPANPPVRLTPFPLPETAISPDRSATPALTPTLTLTPSPEVSATATGPTPTETLLPPLELPTEKPNAPAFTAWTGVPTYAGDSEPGRLFRVDYDPDVWAQTTDDFGQVVLAHRQIEYCILTAWSGRGLPADAQTEHESRQVGNVNYDINTVAIGGAVKFVTYVGGDQRLLTGFQVSFQQQPEQCLLNAETILVTLRSFAAEPSITPTFTLSASEGLTLEASATPTLEELVTVPFTPAP